MIASKVKSIFERVEQLLLTEEELSAKTELAIRELLNVVEALCSDKNSLACGNNSTRKRKPKTPAVARMKSKTLAVATAITRITRPKNGANRAKSQRQTITDHSKISPSMIRSNALWTPTRCLPMPCVAQMKSWSCRISKSSPRILASSDTFYSTRPGKDRLTALKVRQNTDELLFSFGEATCRLLQDEFSIANKWSDEIASLGEVEVGETTLRLLLDSWFGERNKQVRTIIEHAGAIAFYRQQDLVSVVQTLVCDDAGQFKLLTAQLRLKFHELFSTRTGYADLDDRIANTAAKLDELLTVLSVPEVPLHNNASELGARVSACCRDVSLHSRSTRGVRAMDIFTTLVQTSKKLGVSAFEMPSLPQTILQQANAVNAGV